MPKAKIHQLFQLHVDKIVTTFQDKVRASPPPLAYKSKCTDELTLIPDLEFRRLGATIDMNKALKLYNIYRYVLFIYRYILIMYSFCCNCQLKI